MLRTAQVYQIMDFVHNKQEILEKYAPPELLDLENSQKAIPALAKNNELSNKIESVLPTLPTTHRFILGDAVRMEFLEPESVHLIVTSPPYWTLKKYNDNERQLGAVSDYEDFLDELNKVWSTCFEALVPGGRLICVVGDVCLTRRKNNGRHAVIPLHASIQELCRKIGFDNLSPIIWHKISNATHEVAGSSGFLGKPYEPNAIIKNDIEYILMERKPGGYRSPSMIERAFSVISEKNHKKWFNQIWQGVTGASTKDHPAPYPFELATRLIRMFSFVGDVVLDPFSGYGTTAIAACKSGRNSISVEIDDEYFDKAVRRFKTENSELWSNHEVEICKKLTA